MCCVRRPARLVSSRLGLRKCPNHHSTKKFKFWPCAYWIFTLVSRLASLLRLTLFVKSGEASILDWRSFVSDGTADIHVRIAASNYPSKHIPHGACCVGELANVFWLWLGLRKCCATTWLNAFSRYENSSHLIICSYEWCFLFGGA